MPCRRRLRLWRRLRMKVTKLTNIIFLRLGLFLMASFIVFCGLLLFLLAGNPLLPWLLFGLFVFFHLLLGIVVVVHHRHVTGPVCELIRVINMARDGHYAQEIEIERDTELYELGHTFLSLINNLENIKQKINKRKVIELTTLHEISKAMSAVLDIDEVLVMIVNLATQVLEAKTGSLMLIDERARELVIRAANGLPDEVIRSTRIPLGKGIAGTVALEGVPYLSQNIENDPRFRKRSDDKRYETKSFVSVPVKLKDKIIGVININNKASGDVFTEEDLELMQILAHQAAISIENARLYMQAERKIEEMELLFRASKAMSSILNVNTLLKQVLETCTQIVKARAGLILLLDEDHILRSRTLYGDIDLRATFDFQILPDATLSRSLEGLETLQINGGELGDPEIAPLISCLEFVPASILLIPLTTKSTLTGVLAVISDETRPTFEKGDTDVLKALSSQASIVIENAKLYESLKDQFVSTIRVATNALEFKDAYTSGHSERVTEFAILLSKEIGMSADEVEQIRQGAILHDIGKIGVPEAILTKKGRLTDDEYATIKLHPSIGDSIVEPMGLHPWIRSGIRNHHERWDGRGYPDGLKEEEIPLPARIIGIADAFDAMTSNRPYRDALAMEKVYTEIERCAGAQFDPDLAVRFVNMLRRIGTRSIGDETDSSGEFIDNMDLKGDAVLPMSVEETKQAIARAKAEILKQSSEGDEVPAS